VRELYRIQAEFGWTPRDIDTLTLPELLFAQSMVPVLRKERMLEMVQAFRIAQADQADYRRAVEDLAR
jgi:hypothetical protein